MTDANDNPDEPDPPPRIECPNCGCRHMPVVYTRETAAGVKRRRRECHNCGRRITTTEKPLGA